MNNTNQVASTDQFFRICIWNASGLKRGLMELESFMNHLDIQVMLISESHASDAHGLYINGYKIHVTPTVGRGASGGTAIYVKNGFDYSVLPTPVTRNLDSTSIVIKIDNNPIQITSIYQHSNKPVLLEDYNAIFTEDRPIIVGGDFNAKHPHWHSKRSNTRGNKLYKYLHEHRYPLRAVSQLEPTHFHCAGHLPDILDFYIVNRIDYALDIWTSAELSSDHDPVLLDVHAQTTKIERPVVVTDWNRFNKIISGDLPPIPVLNNQREIDENIKLFIDAIQTAIEKASKTKTITPSNSLNPPRYILNKIREKNRIRREWQLLRCPFTKRALNRLQTEIKGDLDKLRNDRWAKTVDEAAQYIPKVWKLTKRLTRPRNTISAIHSERNGLVYLAVDKANAFADSLESQFSPNPLTTSHDLLDEVEDALERLQSSDICSPVPTTPSEIRQFIKIAPKNTAAGYDNIKYTCLRNLPQKAIVFLTKIYNACLRLGYFPQAWKHAIVALIPKPGKDHKFPQNYRPISLLCTTGKVFEKIIHSRLSEWSLDHHIIPKTQHGFVKGLSTSHQLVRTVDYIVEGFNRKHTTLGVFLDVAKAFDRVWHDGLIYKLFSLNCPMYLLKILSNFIQERTFAARYQTAISGSRQMTAGVPQGSVLSPLLFNIYVYDLPNPTNILTAQYADDTAYLYRGKNIPFMIYKAQNALDELHEWTQEWQIQINPDKSQAIFFSKGHKCAPESLTFADARIPWAKEVKYLGLNMDSRLSWNKHITITLAKANNVFGQLKALLLPCSKLPLARRMHIYKAIIRSKMTYGCPAYITMSDTQLNRLERKQNTMIRRIVGAPWFVRNVQLRNETKTPSIKAHILQLAKNHHTNYDVSMLKDHLDLDSANSQKRRRTRRPHLAAAERNS